MAAPEPRGSRGPWGRSPETSCCNHSQAGPTTAHRVIGGVGFPLGRHQPWHRRELDDVSRRPVNPECAPPDTRAEGSVCGSRLGAPGPGVPASGHPVLGGSRPELWQPSCPGRPQPPPPPWAPVTDCFILSGLHLWALLGPQPLGGGAVTCPLGRGIALAASLQNVSLFPTEALPLLQTPSPSPCPGGDAPSCCLLSASVHWTVGLASQPQAHHAEQTLCPLRG